MKGEKNSLSSKTDRAPLLGGKGEEFCGESKGSEMRFYEVEGNALKPREQ